MAQPATATSNRHPCSRPRGLVAIIASAGGVPALLDIFAGLGSNFPLPIVLAQHLAREQSMLAELLSWRTGREIGWLNDGDMPAAGRIQLVRPGHAARVSAERYATSPLGSGARAWLSSPNHLLGSMAREYGAGAVAVMLSGMIPVAIDGMRAIRAHGGMVLAQTTASAEHAEMPAGAIDFAKADLVLKPASIARALNAIAADQAAQAAA